MTNEKAMLWLVSLAEHEGEKIRICADDAEALQMGIDAIKALEQQPCEEYDYKALWEQVKWERDVAIDQLEQLGYSLGEKIRTSEDCISREATINLVHKLAQPCDDRLDWDISADEMIDGIKSLPSVTPSHEDLKEAYIKGYDYGVKDWFKAKTEPCEDAISRKRLIILIDEGAELHPYKVVGDSETYSDYNQGWTDAFDWLYANIDCDNLPSVKPQSKRGKWKYVVDKTGHWVWECDDCEWQQRIATNYCPDCGAEMDKEIKNDKSRSK